MNASGEQTEVLRREWVAWKAAHEGNRAKYQDILSRAIPENCLGGDLSQEEAQRYAPSPVRLYRDTFNMRWQAYLLGACTRSRSFALYGPSEALALVLRLAWSERLLWDGQTIESCRLAGFVDKPATAASSSRVGPAPSGPHRCPWPWVLRTTPAVLWRQGRIAHQRYFRGHPGFSDVEEMLYRGSPTLNSLGHP